MMKKYGFTLAEVLITLAIIGVVATITLPTLTSNTNEKQAVAAFKKGLNTLTEAGNTNLALHGFDYSSVTAGAAIGSSDEPGRSIPGILYNGTQVDRARSGSGSKFSHVINGTSNTSNYVIYFRDGSSISFSTTLPSDRTTITDGLPKGIPAVYDYNGSKGPNIVSNCQNNTAGSTNDKGDIAICTPQKRIIRDQFAIRLRGPYAVPNGAASKWAAVN